VKDQLKNHRLKAGELKLWTESSGTHQGLCHRSTRWLSLWSAATNRRTHLVVWTMTKVHINLTTRWRYPFRYMGKFRSTRLNCPAHLVWRARL